MFDDYVFTVTDRFLRYVQINTQSDPESKTFPSSSRQMKLSKLLQEELTKMGATDVSLENGYVMATIPSNTTKKIPVICFCAHVDTAPDCSGDQVKPVVHTNYQGTDITFEDDPSLLLKAEDFPYLKQKIGENIITASGKTLLGADDKSGVAEIMDMAYYFLTHPAVRHGEIRLLFTPDEEVGRGVEKLDMKRLGADFGYTVDGGDKGDLEDETFSADSLKLCVKGIIAHPGSAKGRMVNAIKLLTLILDALPKDHLSPETTEGREGFIHPVAIGGNADEAFAEFILRDFESSLLSGYGTLIRSTAKRIISQYPGCSFSVDQHEQYRNMKEILSAYPDVTALAKRAYIDSGLVPRNEPIRGGTDGSRLSFMGLPCPNIFSGMQAIHSRREWISEQDMHKAVEVLVRLSVLWEQYSS